MSNIIFGSKLIGNALKRGISPLIVKKWLNNTNKSSIILWNRCINTSEKKKDYKEYVQSYVPGLMDPQPKGPKTVKEFADIESQKNWITFGWDIGNMQNDRYFHRVSCFAIITFGMVIIPYILIYFPDFGLRDWVTREAYLEIDRRERLGLPLIDKNLVDPNLLVLPSDEELGDTEIYV